MYTAADGREEWTFYLQWILGGILKWMLPSSRMWRRVVWLTSVSEERTASIFRVSFRFCQYVSPKRPYISARLRDVTSQTTVISLRCKTLRSQDFKVLIKNIYYFKLIRYDVSDMLQKPVCRKSITVRLAGCCWWVQIEVEWEWRLDDECNT